MFVQDCGPRLRRESELCEAHKIRVLRQMAEGVAHHFGQILSTVETQVNLLSQSGNIAGNLLAEQVISETRRGGALVRQLLAVGSCQGIQLEASDINQLIHFSESILRRLISECIALDLQLADELPLVLADPKLLEHILFNLVLNARDAMPHGGTIEVMTQQLCIQNPPMTGQSNANSARFVRLTVRDNGYGITPEIQEHLFEPFFTTREDGKAMGLGLATVHGAVKQQGGWIEFATEPGRGSEFNVFLPVAPAVSRPEICQVPALAEPDRGTILLVESDDRVRDLAHHILARNGYFVIEADCPGTALILMEAQTLDIQLLLTDLSFRDQLSGHELATQLQQTRPGLRVLYTTGTLDAHEHDPAILENSKLLLKPYTSERLVQSVGSCLQSHV
jgi:nitrogen-specific signal transduction histidine kinase/CheY-like chemotaxis protein